MKKVKAIKLLMNSAIVFVSCGVFVFLPFAACNSDDLDSTITQENSYYNSQEIIPLPGDSGMISPSAITGDSLQLAWTRAIDDKTSQPELEYRVFRAEASIIGTPVDAELNGTPLTDWAADVTSLNVSGLESGKVYYFNVIVRAKDGRKAAYMMASATTVGVVYMYSAGSHTGNLTTPYTASARADVDKLCTPIPVAGPATARAFISINAADEIRDFPANFGVPPTWPVKSIAGNQIAWTWDDMLDGSINMKLVKAKIADNFWWSGSAADGSFDSTNNCSGWTDGTNASDGMAGFHNEITGEWLARDVRNCNTPFQVLCVAW